MNSTGFVLLVSCFVGTDEDKFGSLKDCKMKWRITFCIIQILLSGCNYALLVDKSRVVNIKSGYLIFYRDQQIFFPAKSIQGNDFFKSAMNKVGYIIHFEKDAEVYRGIAKKYVIERNYQYEGESISRVDTMGIIAVEIRTLPYEHQGEREMNELTFKYNNASKAIKYYNTNNEGVWSVYPILKSDLKQIDKYYN